MVKCVKLVLDPSVRDLCQRPYPGHRAGCPNWGTKAGCPPSAPLINKVLDMAEPVWAIWVEFDIAAQRQRMWARHPKWSRRQAECCLYWQRGVLATLKRHVCRFCTQQILYATGDWKLDALYCPEAHGVNVTETMRGIGVKLEWPPENIVRKIAVVGSPVRDRGLERK